MSEKELLQVAENARFIVGGYAFTQREDGFVSILNLYHPECAMVVNKDGEIIALANRNPRNDPNIYEVCFDYTVGDQVKKFHVGPNRIGHVITQGRTLSEATNALDRALGNIEIEVI